MREFKINENIILKLENGKTNIYIKDEFFNQCKFILLRIPVNKMHSFDEFESIDEIGEQLDRSLEIDFLKKSEITPEIEFWAHCSNIQAWYELNYDTRLLDSRLSFPLLKKLTDIGDPMAKIIFKEEIVKRFQSGYPSVVSYLYEEDYLGYLEEGEQEILNRGFGLKLIKNLSLKDTIIDILNNQEKNLDSQDLLEYLIRFNKELGKNHIIQFFKELSSNLEDELISTLWDELEQLSIDSLNYISEFSIKELKEFVLGFLEILGDDDIKRLKHVEYKGEKFYIFDGTLIINNTYDSRINDITEIKGLNKLKNLKVLNLSYNKIKEIKGIENLINLEELKLFCNEISEIKGLNKLKNLKVLNLSDNKIKEIKGLEQLLDLKELYLDDNNISEMKGLETLNNLRKFSIHNNNLTKYMMEVSEFPQKSVEYCREMNNKI